GDEFSSMPPTRNNIRCEVGKQKGRAFSRASSDSRERALAKPPFLRRKPPRECSRHHDINGRSRDAHGDAPEQELIEAGAAGKAPKRDGGEQDSNADCPSAAP